MARQKLRAVVRMMDGDDVRTMLTIDESGKAEYALPMDEIERYDRLMLLNIARADSEIYAREVSA